MTTEPTTSLTRYAADADAQEALGRQLAHALHGRGVVYLQGDLGAGKTTLTRGILRGYGHSGTVKSPTYTLVESYELACATVYHFDLYRLTDSEELELLGIRDYCRPDCLVLVEWPDRGYPFLPPADLIITIQLEGVGRLLELTAQNDAGQQTLTALITNQGG